MSGTSNPAVLAGQIVHAWANKGARDYVVALTATHIVTSGNTNNGRGSQKLIAEWNQKAPDQWKNRKHSLPIEEILEMRSMVTYTSFVRDTRITVSTKDTVLTMPGFRNSQRADAADCIANAAGLVETSTVRGAEQFPRPGQLVNRFDGDGAESSQNRPAGLTVRSLFWTLHAAIALRVCALWGSDVISDDSLNTGDAVTQGSADGKANCGTG